MAKTRKSQQECLDRLLKEIFKMDLTDKDDPFLLWLIVNTVNSVFGMISWDLKDIDTTTYTDANGITKPLPGQAKARLRILKAYELSKGGMEDDDWNQFTIKDYNEFRTSSNYNPNSQNPGVITTTTAGTAKIVDVVADFMKGVKRDATAYPKLQDDTEWDNWNRSIVSTAHTQGLEDIIDETFVPASNVDKALFKKKQEFMYNVFDTTLKTDYGKKIVRKHFETADAQKVYVELKAHYTKSTKSQHVASDLLKYITSAKIGDGKWKGTAQGFIIHWQDQVRKYDKLVDDPVDQFSAPVKTTLLQNAVADMDCLRAVKDNEDQAIARGGAKLDYDNYAELVLSAATNHDIHLAPKNKMIPSNRGVYHTDIVDNVNDSYDIDSSVNMIQVNFARTSSMPKNRWDSLPPKIKELWDTIDEESKGVILGNIDPTTKEPITRPTTTQRPARGRDNNRKRFNNEHDIIRAFVAHQQQHESSADEVSQEEVDDEEEDGQLLKDILLAYNTVHNAAQSDAAQVSKSKSPSDIRSVLSQTPKASSTTKKEKLKVNEVTLNGQIYRMVKDGTT